MAGKTEQNAGGSGEAWTPSAVLIDALGEHAEQQGLKQDEGESEIDFAVRCIEALGGLVVGMTIAADVLEEERDALKRQLSSQKGAATKARGKIEEMIEAAKPRKLEPVDLPLDGDEKPSVLELQMAIDCAGEVVLAFSDGKAEIRGIAPRKVSAADFKLTRGRLLFDRPDLTVTGPGGEGASAPQLAGVALLLDGEQFAWSPLAKAIDLGAGQTFNLAGSVIFG